MTTASRDLDGKVAIVTGAAGGIGSVTAQVLVELGAKVVLADLPNTALVEKTSAAGSKEQAVSCVVDISDESSVKALMDFTVKTFGGIDIVHNNAARQGLPDDLDVLSMSVETWDSVFSVNARGTMLMCKHSLPVLFERGGGSIINMSSGTAV